MGSGKSGFYSGTYGAKKSNSIPPDKLRKLDLTNKTSTNQVGVNQNETKRKAEKRYVFSRKNKKDAIQAISELPEAIRKPVKKFIDKSSNRYTEYKVLHNKNNTYTIYMTKPGDVPGSKAIYHKQLSSDGEVIRVYKSTYGPDGKLIHIKEK